MSPDDAAPRGGVPGERGASGDRSRGRREDRNPAGRERRPARSAASPNPDPGRASQADAARASEADAAGPVGPGATGQDESGEREVAPAAASAAGAAEAGTVEAGATEPRAARPIEVELKFAVADPSVTERLLVADEIGPFQGRTPERAIQIEDRYVDSAAGDLARAGFAARLRQTPTGVIASIKSTHSVDGALQRREEIEGPADRSLDPHAWPPSAARALVLELAGDAPLVELVTIRQLRRRRDLRADGSVVELSVDDVDVISRGDVVERFTELEVELVSGDETALGTLREVLERQSGLRPAAGSKLDRALVAARRAGAPVDALAGIATGDGRPAASEHAGRKRDREVPRGVGNLDTGSSASPEGKTGRKSSRTGVPEDVAKPDLAADAVARPADRLIVGKSPGVAADDTLAEAGRKVLRFHLARMLAREAGTREGTDPEDLHSMRVATRRMRAAWRVFGDAYRPGRTRRFRARLRDIAGRLGAVRDRDVLIEGLEHYRAGLASGERGSLEPLLDAWRSERDVARDLLVAELDAGGYRRFVDEYVDFTGREGVGVAPVAPTEPHRVRDTAPSRIWAAYEQVRAYEPVLRWADVATLHQLRIAGKRLRYSLEFVRETLPPEAATLIERVVALQDHLGLLNDADVAASLARSFLLEHAGRLSESEEQTIGHYLASREAEIQRLRRSLGPVWRRVAGLTFRRALGRVTASL